MIYPVTVIKGAGRGKHLGFPTLNLTIPDNFTHSHGIYAGWVYFGDQKLQGAFHFGPIPTFDSPTPSLEVFILNHSFTSTPKQVKIHLLKKLRPVKTFASKAKLIAQIKKDVALVKQLLNKAS